MNFFSSLRSVSEKFCSQRYLELKGVLGVIELAFDEVDVREHQKVLLQILGHAQLDLLFLLQVDQEQPEHVEAVEAQERVLVCG